MKKNSKQRLFEMMGKIDPSFKPKLNEDAFNDAGEPMMTHQQFRDYSEPAEPDYDSDRDMPIQNKSVHNFKDIDWKMLYDVILQNSRNPNSRDNATVNDLTDYDGILSPEEFNMLKMGNVGIWYDKAGDYPMFDVATGESFPTYEEFYAKAKDVFEHPEKIQTRSGKDDSEAPFLRGNEPMSEGDSSFPTGVRVKVSDGSGLDSNKTGTVVSPREVKTDGRGIPTNIEGAYDQVDWKKEVAVRLDDGSLITMFKNRLNRID